jgi:hypothetical protein
MGVVSDWKGVILHPFETFEGLKPRASFQVAAPHLFVSLLPTFLMYGVFALIAGPASLGSVVTALVIQLVLMLVMMVVAFLVAYGIAKVLGGTGSLEQHFFATSVTGAAYAVLFSLVLLVFGILGFIMVGPPVLAALGGNIGSLGAAIIGALVLVLIFALVALVVSILSIRSGYYLFKSVHGFGVGKYLVFILASILVYVVLVTIIGMVFGTPKPV